MKKLLITIISDATGETADQLVKVSLGQFTGIDPEIVRYTNVRELYDLESILANLSTDASQIIYYSLVGEQLTNHLRSFADMHDIYTVDIMTPSLIAIERVTDLLPSERPGLVRALDEQYFKRVEAMEFTVRYDDGKDPRGVLSADIVILGVSRTSKTPLSMYLANKGYRVCNIPLVPESPPPEEIFKVPSSKVVGLTNNPDNLIRIRKERLKSLGVHGPSAYSDQMRIFDELEYARGIMRQIGCPIIDVANRAIEETAEIILSHRKKMNL